MVKSSIVYDYLILVQLVISILAYLFFNYSFKGINVLFSCILFFSYWTIKLIFNPENKEMISGN